MFFLKWYRYFKCCSPFHSQLFIINSPFCLPHSSYDVSLENLILDQLIVPLLIFLFFSDHLCAWYCTDKEKFCLEHLWELNRLKGMKVLLNGTWPRNVCFLYFDQDGLLAQGNQELIMRIFNKIPKRSPDGKRLQVHYLFLCLLSVLILTEVRIVKEKKTFAGWWMYNDSITTRGSA